MTMLRSLSGYFVGKNHGEAHQQLSCTLVRGGSIQGLDGAEAPARFSRNFFVCTYVGDRLCRRSSQRLRQGSTANKEKEVAFDGGHVTGVDSSELGDEDRIGAEEGGERSWLGNRWPREETLALLNVRAEMDVNFRDATLKAPLWEEISRFQN